MADQNNELVLTRVFDAPVAAVWKAWSEPEAFKKWWGPTGFSAKVGKWDFRVGGKYHVAMHGPAGSEWDKDMWSTGTYQEIEPMKKIVVTDSFADENGNVVSATHYGMTGTFPMETTIEIIFEEVEGGKTKMTMHHQGIEGIEGKMLEDMKQGWEQSFDKLAASLIK